jgi:hypothetical protein
MSSGHCSTFRKAMSCPERATARRMGSIGFQPLLFTLTSDVFSVAEKPERSEKLSP